MRPEGNDVDINKPWPACSETAETMSRLTQWCIWGKECREEGGGHVSSQEVNRETLQNTDALHGRRRVNTKPRNSSH